MRRLIPARLRALWRGLPDWIGQRVDYAAKPANDCGGGDD